MTIPGIGTGAAKASPLAAEPPGRDQPLPNHQTRGNTLLPDPTGTRADRVVGVNVWRETAGQPAGSTTLRDSDGSFLVQLSIGGTLVQKPHLSDEDVPSLFSCDFFFDRVAPSGDGSFDESAEHTYDVFGLDVPWVAGIGFERGCVLPVYRQELVEIGS